MEEEVGKEEAEIYDVDDDDVNEGGNENENDFASTLFLQFCSFCLRAEFTLS